jgi:class 3 adenylate cyclase
VVDIGDGELNVMLPGQHVTAIFGFCDIRKFTDATEVLRGAVMPFVNLCAKIVHGRVVKYGGAPNKNVGDAFLCVWKTEDVDAVRSTKTMSLRTRRRLSLGGDMLAMAAAAAKATSEADAEAHADLCDNDHSVRHAAMQHRMR